MSEFRKKAVIIEAKQLDGVDDHDVYLWVAEQTISYDYTSENKPDVGVTIDPAGGRMVIKTLEGEMHASPGDWIIRGVQGEFYPCKPDIFEQTYEPVEEADRD